MPRLLLVDDDRDGLEVRRLVFESHGYSTMAENTADGALRAFTEHSPDVVVLDLCLPEAKDGLTLIRDLRAVSSGVRIFVLTGWPADLRGRPEAAIVDQVFEKPVRTEKLLRAVGGRVD